MTWAKLDDQYADHPKIVAVGPLADWLHTCAIVYCSRYLTDGFVPAIAVAKLANFEGVATLVNGEWQQVNVTALVTALLQAKLWDECDGGYVLHDFLQYNPSAEKVKEDRVKEAKRIAEWRERQRQRPLEGGNGVSNAVGNDVRTSVPVPVPILNPVNDDDEGAVAPLDVDLAAAVKRFENDIHLIANPYQAQEMTELFDQLKARNVLTWWDGAIKIACRNNARSWAYVKTVLENALRDGCAPGANKPRQRGNNGNSGHTRADTRDGYNVPTGYEGLVNTDALTVDAPDPWRDLLAEADALAPMVRQTPQVKERTLKQLARKLDGILAALPVPYDAALATLGEHLRQEVHTDDRNEGDLLR